MKITLEALLTLAGRYADIAAAQKAEASPERAAQLDRLESTLRKVPARGAENLYEAIQSFLLLWEVMCLEQAPNPFAFSVGNADRIFEPYRRMGGTSREEAAALFKHFLAFFNVGDRSWAISQNVLIGGRDNEGRDLTNETSYALLDAYYDMNVPQPILSVKLHRNTPAELYEAMGRFFFTPGCLTPPSSTTTHFSRCSAAQGWRRPICPITRWRAARSPSSWARTTATPPTAGSICPKSSS